MQFQTSPAKKSVVAAFAFSLFCSSSIAQTTPINRDAYSDLVVLYLQHDMLLTPGRGLRNVRIGQDFEDVVKIWGNPNHIQKRLLKSDVVWTYESENSTRMILTGNKTVETITIVGEPASLYQSTEGARFGMTANEIARLYPGPVQRGKTKRLSYPHLGISFGFKGGTLVAMQVFTPRGR